MEGANGNGRWVLVCHGGAGRLRREANGGELEEMRAALRRALSDGAEILRAGGQALDAVQRAVRVMEDCPLLNAGRGSVLNEDGFVELDAALMNGADRAAGAVAAVRTVCNPVDLAREVMRSSPHVLLVGDGAERFAAERGVALMSPDYFITPQRRRELARRRQGAVPEDGSSKGTVGAVALDRSGNLAAATSTGGMTGKRVGRVGDTPLVGAGTYAENGVCAVSATGDGEYFIRATAAAAVASRLRYGGEELSSAARAVIDEIAGMGGEGGLIAVDAAGNLAMPFSAEAMLRGCAGQDRPPEVWL
ncbi:MAG: beta-aspartyl-peptidase [Alphaproteobacteria bacterium]|nr:beta-aspartyl-peptidase [Alphaproteobacteria bacterium]